MDYFATRSFLSFEEQEKEASSVRNSPPPEDSKDPGGILVAVVL